MKKFLMVLCAVSFVFGVIGSAGAVLITFDDISGDVEVTDQYQALGILFDDTWELDTWNTVYAPVKYTGDHVAYCPIIVIALHFLL